MKLLIDDANIETIQELLTYCPVDGVTTNPTILSRTHQSPYKVLKAIRQLIGEEAELHVQVVASEAGEMVKDAMRILEVLGNQTFVKVPVTKEGLRAIQLLSSQSVQVTATAIYTPMQAYLAAKAGAKYAAPYVNRIDNLGHDGIATAQLIHDIFKKNGLACEVLAASFKNVRQVQALTGYGVGACTVSSEVMKAFLQLDAVEQAVQVFNRDFESLCGPGRNMHNI